MKFVLMTIGLFSIFHAVLSLKCYSCNYPKTDYDEMLCTHPTQVECRNGAVCGKATTNLYGETLVIKHCKQENTCLGDEITVNVDGVNVTSNCCKSNLCNGSENVF